VRCRGYSSTWATGWSGIRKCSTEACLEARQEVTAAYLFHKDAGLITEVVPLRPLLFQLGAFIGELLGDAFDYVGDEAVCTLDSLTGLVDIGGLYLVPAYAEVMKLIVENNGVTEFSGVFWVAITG
jgi:hypothetical protein